MAKLTLAAPLFALMLLCMNPAVAEITRASDWLGRVVLTSDGELLGRVEDLALTDGREVAFVVVSVGSFLVDDNLIAVAPDALVEASDEDYLTIDVDLLGSAPRFGAGSWPRGAQVLAPDDDSATEIPGGTVPAQAGTGSATIVSNDRRGSITGEQTQPLIEAQTPARTPSVRGVQPRAKTITAGVLERETPDADFKRMDSDGDYYLSRRELGANLPADMHFADFDLDGNDGLDAFEYRVLRETLE